MAQPTRHIFILAGGSNMAGRGGVEDNNQWDSDVPPQCAPDITKIYRLNADLRWEIAKEPLHEGIDNKDTCGVGPGMAFANSIKKYLGDNYVIGLVPCAVGRSAIKEWGRGTPLYGNIVKRAKLAVVASIPTPAPSTAPSYGTSSDTTTDTTSKCTTIFSICSTVTSTSTASPTATATQAVTSTSTDPPTATAIATGREIKALLWFQGESDAKSDDDANNYQKKMEELIANIREDLKLPGLPVIQVAIPSGDGNKTNIEKVRKAQLEMKVENAKCIDAKGLAMKQCYHLTSAAQVQLGNKLASTYREHFAERCPPTANDN